MPFKLFQLIYGVRTWSETELEIRNRLEGHLVRLRKARVAELLALRETAPEEDEEQLLLPLTDTGSAFSQPAPELEIEVELTPRERSRIANRARRLLAARAVATGLGHLREPERKIIEARLPGVRLAGPISEDAADEMGAALLDELPWLREPVAHIWRGARRSAREGMALGFGPILLNGPPAAGKTYLARRVAELAGAPLVTIDLGAGGEAFRVSGVTRGWSSASPGRPVEEILATGIGNPIVAVEEVDKAGGARGSDGFRTSAWDALLGLLEPGSAAKWECPYYRVRLDLRQVNWVLTSNDVRWLPAPLLSRLTIINVQQPSPGDLAGVAFREGARRGLDEESLEMLARAILQARGALTLRHLMRALDALQVAHERAVLH